MYIYIYIYVDIKAIYETDGLLASRGSNLEVICSLGTLHMPTVTVWVGAKYI